MSRAVAFWVGLLFVLAGTMVVWQVSKRGGATAADAGSHREVDDEAVVESPRLTEFELLDQRGNRVSSNILKGQVWAGSFFFAKCPGTCYHQNMKLAELNAKYAERGFQIFSITCDPKNDNPVALASYASRFNANVDSWKFLSPSDGNMEYLRKIGRECLGVAVDQSTHTDRVVLFDRAGEVAGVYSVLKPEQFTDLDRKIASLLDEATEGPDVTSPEGESDDSSDDGTA